MKKLLILIILGSLLLTGCAKSGQNDLQAEIREELVVIEDYEDTEVLEGYKGVTMDTLNYELLSEGRIKQIRYDESYKQKEDNYLVLFTHEKCDFCMDLWFDRISKYEGDIEIYLVDLNDDYNKGAWEIHSIKGVPLIVEVKSGVMLDKYTGVLDIEKRLINNENKE